MACLIFLTPGISTIAVFTAESGLLRVGVAKVDMTPADPTKSTNLFQIPYAGVHDKICARALVVSDGPATAAIIAADMLEAVSLRSLEASG